MTVLVYAVDVDNNCRWVPEALLLENGGQYSAIPWMNESMSRFGRMEKTLDEPDVPPACYQMPDMYRHVTYAGMTDSYRKNETRKQPVADAVHCGHGGYVSVVDDEIVHAPLYPLQGCSPKAAERINSYVSSYPVKATLANNEIYPFETMQIGQCFIVSMNSPVAKRIRIITSKKNAKTPKQFIVVKHAEFECLEVARIV